MSILHLLLAAQPALAWNSHADGEVGPLAAREVWTDEHRDIYAIALAAYGVDTEVTEVDVYTDGSELSAWWAGHIGDFDTVAPAADWADVQAVQTRPFELAMYADLPDFAWSLSGWAGGNETCPIDGASEPTCWGPLSETLVSWLVAGLNSTHFLPQSGAAYGWYHQLALDTADRCAAMHSSLHALSTADDEAIEAVVRQCEQEAYMFEGVAQHYLQDSWSSGHMWQRWGSPSRADWPGDSDLAAFGHAAAVGAISGLIHGTEEDPLCAPNHDVHFVPGNGSAPIPGIGDLSFELLISGASPAPEQDVLMWSCVLGSVDEVVTRLPGVLGGESTGLTFPGDTDCFGQRVTNEAISNTTGFALVDGHALALRWLSRLELAFDLVGALVDLADADAENINDQFRESLVELAILHDAAKYTAANDPLGTNLADGIYRMEDGSEYEVQMMGMRPNGAYIDRMTDGLSTYDPSVEVQTGDATDTTEREAQAEVLRRALPAAHVDTWCEDGLAEAVDTLGTACRTTIADDDAEDGVADAQCGACAELGTWLRVAGAVGDDALPAEVCDAFPSTDSRSLYLPDWVDPNADSSTERVEAWCRAGCATILATTAVNATDADVDFDDVLSTYFTEIEAKIIANQAMASSMLSMGQWSAAEYYQQVATNQTNDLLAVASLLGAARFPENGLARWEGGATVDDFEGTLQGLIAVSEHAVGHARTDLTDLPEQNVVLALESADTFPFLFNAKAKPRVDADTGAITLLLSDALFIVTPYLQNATLDVRLDETSVGTLTNITTHSSTLELPLTPGETHRLSFDVGGYGLDDSSLYATDYTQWLEFRILAMDLYALTGNSQSCGLIEP